MRFLSGLSSATTVSIIQLMQRYHEISAFSPLPITSNTHTCHRQLQNKNQHPMALFSTPEPDDAQDSPEPQPLPRQSEPQTQPTRRMSMDMNPSLLSRSATPTTPAELLPRNRGKIVSSKYMPPQGEAWKENIFPRDAPKLITVDPFDTLIQLKSEMGWFFRDILQEATDYNARLLPPEHYTAAYEKAFREVSEEAPCFGVRDGLTSKEWWRKVTEKTYSYVDITEPGLREDLDEWLLEDVFDVLFHDVFMTEEAWEIMPGALEALSYYKKWRDEPNEGPQALVILTNFDERMHAILDELDFLDAFDAVLTSREIGSQLPERSAFQVAMARFGISDPKECMHISAEFQEGVVGAAGADWHGVYIPVTGEQDVPPGTDPDMIFSMLGDMFGVLHIWDKEPENRLIDTTRPVLENGVFAFHEKIWEDDDIITSSENESIYLPPSDRTKSWEGPGRL